MERLAHIVARVLQALWRASSRKWNFLALFVCIFALSVLLLSGLDWLPDPVAYPRLSEPGAALVGPGGSTDTVLPERPEDPVKIEIPTLALSATIANPATTDSKTLDADLLKGAVRYPTSARLNEDGNVVLFGHSSYLPVVHNPAYKTFDGIQKLAVGDRIIVYSAHTAYTYTVRSVQKENANEGVIPLSVTGRVLTLSTCNSFATKDDRFVVTADFVDSRSLGA